MQQFKKYKFLKDLEWLKNLDPLQYKNCNITYNKFQEKYLKIIDKNIAYKMLSTKETKLKQKPWISKVILTSNKIKMNKFIPKIKKKKVSRLSKRS